MFLVFILISSPALAFGHLGSGGPPYYDVSLYVNSVQVSVDDSGMDASLIAKLKFVGHDPPGIISKLYGPHEFNRMNVGNAEDGSDTYMVWYIKKTVGTHQVCDIPEVKYKFELIEYGWFSDSKTTIEDDKFNWSWPPSDPFDPLVAGKSKIAYREAPAGEGGGPKVVFWLKVKYLGEKGDEEGCGEEIGLMIHEPPRLIPGSIPPVVFGISGSSIPLDFEISNKKSEPVQLFHVISLPDLEFDEDEVSGLVSLANPEWFNSKIFEGPMLLQQDEKFETGIEINLPQDVEPGLYFYDINILDDNEQFVSSLDGAIQVVSDENALFAITEKQSVDFSEELLSEVIEEQKIIQEQFTMTNYILFIVLIAVLVTVGIQVAVFMKKR